MQQPPHCYATAPDGQTTLVCNQPPRLSQSGHPSMCRQIGYWQMAMVSAAAREETASSTKTVAHVIRTLWYTDQRQLKTLAINMSRPSGQHWLYASLIGSNKRYWLEALLHSGLCRLCKSFFFLEMGERHGSACQYDCTFSSFYDRMFSMCVPPAFR